VEAAEEGRGKLRKAPGSRKQAVIRRHPNGATLPTSWSGIPGPIDKSGKASRGTETSQYPEERKASATPKVAASEMG
jgi:hypothetical protein